MDTRDFFKEFSKVGSKDWKTKAIEDLKGEDFAKKLVWKTYEGFDVMPFYTREDINPLAENHTKAFSDKTENSWINYQEIDEHEESEANRKAIHALAFDCHGLIFNLEGSVDFSILLKGINPAQTHISFKTHQPLKVIQRYFEYLQKHQIPLGDIAGFCDYDILGAWMTSDSSLEMNDLVEIIQLTREAPGFYGLNIHSGDFVNSGASFTQELAFTLCKLVDYVDLLTEAGLSKSEVIENIFLDISLTGDFFFEVAKLRALRVLLKGILSAYGLSSIEIPILGSNSIWSKSRYDYHVNMLRNTTEAMSAIIGGCDALLVQPHDKSYEKPSSFSHRIAVNISNLLKEESYFDKVVDPVAGSYYVEHLTKELSEKAHQLFESTEAEGGLIKLFKAGKIQEQIGVTRALKEKDLSTRKLVFVGTNKYPNIGEQMEVELKDKVVQSADGRELLAPQRATRLFDLLKNSTQQLKHKLGRLPKVYLSTFGNLSMRKARAGFAAEFFGVAGFEILGEFYQESIDSRLNACVTSEADIIVLCSSDQEYGVEGIELLRKLKEVNTDKYLVVAGYPKDQIDQLSEAGADEFIHVKSNAISIIRGIQERLLTIQS